jgi:hypothetical protein
MKTLTSVPAQYRQGDCMLERVETLPAGLKKAPRVGGKLILAAGLSGRHNHILEHPKSLLLQDEDNNQFVAVAGKRIRGKFLVLRRQKGVLLIVGGRRIKFSESDVELSGPETALFGIVDGSFDLLTHDGPTPDHDAQAVRAGYYRRLPQRELRQGDIRTVTD